MKLVQVNIVLIRSVKVTESDNQENSPRSRDTLAWDVNGSQQRLRSMHTETFSGRLMELSLLATCYKRGAL